MHVHGQYCIQNAIHVLILRVRSVSAYRNLGCLPTRATLASSARLARLFCHYWAAKATHPYRPDYRPQADKCPVV
jgi:hypothetical protein